MIIQWFPGHMAKARKEIEEKLKIVDVVFVLLDARIPLSSQNPLINEILKNKPRLYILTKADMADKNETLKWQSRLEDDITKTLVVDSISGYNIKKVENVTKEILKEKIEKDLRRGMKVRPIRAMIVGIPNVGKSTFINKIVNKKVTNVGNMPGVTKAQQWIRLNQNIELLDTPGVLWPKFEDQKVGIHLALTGAIKDEILPKEDLVQYLLDFLRKYYSREFSNKYEIDINLSNIMIFDEIIKKRGFKSEDYERVYDVLLNDFKNARIGRITLDRV